MKTNNFAVSFLALVALFSANFVSAENYTVGSIQVVDMQAVLDRSKGGREATLKLKAAIAASEKLLADRKEEMEAERRALEKQASLLSEKAFEEKQQSLVRKSQDLQQLMMAERQKVDLVRNEAISGIVKKANEAIAEISKEKGYQLVVEKSSPLVLYSAGAEDITPQIISKIGG